MNVKAYCVFDDSLTTNYTSHTFQELLMLVYDFCQSVSITEINFIVRFMQGIKNK